MQTFDQEMLLVWSLVVGLLLAIPTFESVKGVDDINISDEEILKTLLEVQEKILNDDEKIHLFNGVCDLHHPQIKADLRLGQQQARILEMTTRKLADQMG